jgi:hypothetical protein
MLFAMLVGLASGGASAAPEIEYVGASNTSSSDNSRVASMNDVSSVYKIGLSGSKSTVSSGMLSHRRSFVLRGDEGSYSGSVTSTLGFGYDNPSSLEFQLRGSGWNCSLSDRHVDGSIDYDNCSGDVPSDINSYQKLVDALTSKYPANRQCGGKSDSVQNIARLALLCNPNERLDQAHKLTVIVDKGQVSEKRYDVITRFREVRQESGMRQGLTMQYAPADGSESFAYKFPVGGGLPTDSGYVVALNAVDGN